MAETDLDNITYTYDLDYIHSIYMYPGYGFERPTYLYIWQILVIVTSLINAVVIAVLVRSKMRNSTNIILLTIAVSDSLTGLVTLPSTVMVYQKFEPAIDYSDVYGDYFEGYRQNNSEFNATTNPYSEYEEPVSQEGYSLDETLCRYFMVSKFFVSKVFHTISIWLTLFLAIQRFISVALPFKAQTWFTKGRTVTLCVLIATISLLLHIYHLLNNKAESGLCQWLLKDTDTGGVAYLWISFLTMHFIPCILLFIFTILFIFHIRKSSKQLKRMSSDRDQAFEIRSNENRRLTITVTVIVIVFLIPELPYGLLVMYTVILKHTTQELMDLKTNRAVQMVYEIVLVVSFHANFYVLTFLSRKFRLTLKETIPSLVSRVLCSCCTDSSRSSITRSLSTDTAGLHLAMSNKNNTGNSHSANGHGDETSRFIENHKDDDNTLCRL